ncbi:MAG: S9 family peptidase [Phycisphaeraceae bacterium]|nr:MAG: S9 family peptidase [Phycisphaeraceae bacterium]
MVGCASRGERAAVDERSSRIAGPVEYPEAMRIDHVDELHGVRVEDPYRWMEESDSSELDAWVRRQNELAMGVIESIPHRDAINERMTELWNYERISAPSRRGGRYFFSRNDGLQNQSVLLTTQSLADEPRVLLDPNTFSEDGTVSLAGTSVSHDGRLIAYGKSDGGSDWREYFVRDVETGEDLGDHLKWIKFSTPSWTTDNKGFFYSRYDEPESDDLMSVNYYQKLYYHRLGTPQDEDELIFEDPDNKEHGFSGRVTDDGRYLIISVWKGTARENLIYYKDLSSPGSDVVRLIDEWKGSFSFIDNDGPVFWFHTNFEAPRNRVIAIDTSAPAPERWSTVIPEERATLRGVNVVGERFLASYLADAHTRVKVFGLDGRFQREVDLPGIGSAGGFGGQRSDEETFYTFSGFTTPPTVYRYDIHSGTSEFLRAPDVDFDPDRYITRQVFYRSADGTRIPMFITHLRGLRMTGDNPTLLFGYGGFNIPMTPGFSVSNLVWMEMGGIYAVANLRGGGEYGQDWHDAGRLLNKQNTFDDFIAAAEWLIDNRYTNSSRLAIAGGSNGGLLVGACMVQRPELFGAALPAVGVLDMLRFHLFTIGWAWVSDYGSPDDPVHFENLLAYSPLHNVQPGTCYPPTLINTAWRDDRVAPAHSFKFAAALQAAQACDNPILIRVETRAGHGAGKPTWMVIEEVSDRWAFLVDALGFEPRRPER